MVGGFTFRPVCFVSKVSILCLSADVRLAYDGASLPRPESSFWTSKGAYETSQSSPDNRSSVWPTYTTYYELESGMSGLCIAVNYVVCASIQQPSEQCLFYLPRLCGNPLSSISAQWHNNGVGQGGQTPGAPSSGQKKLKIIFCISQIAHTLYCHLHKIYKYNHYLLYGRLVHVGETFNIFCAVNCRKMRWESCSRVLTCLGARRMGTLWGVGSPQSFVLANAAMHRS